MNRYVILFLFFHSICMASDHPESWYVENWCTAHGGVVEVVLEDRTRCDCITETHAIEFDFGAKYYQAIGQSLHYGRMTGKKPGIVLILESDSDIKYWDRLLFDVSYWLVPVDLWSYGAGMDNIFIPNSGWDINNDQKLGIEEAINALRVIVND
jgi:hypothetical protein